MVSASRIVPLVGQVYQSQHAKRQRTLAHLVAALITVGKIGVAALGRAIPGKVSMKHRIKQVDRFLSNEGLHVPDWCECLLTTVIGPRRSLRIAIDWTKVGEWPVLVASIVVRRRGIPVWWAACDPSKMSRSMNAIEEAFLLQLRTMIPRDVETTLLFDRGFRRVALVRFLREHGFHFVIRCPGDTSVWSRGFSGSLRSLKLVSGQVRDLGVVDATKRRPEPVRVVAVHDRGQKDAWYLFSDLDLPGRDIVRLYGRRFTIEEVFRDQKSTRYGWSLGEYKLKSRVDRLDRLLLVIATAYFLVTLAGLAVQNRGKDRGFRANTERKQTHSLFQLGWKGHRLVRWLPASWWALFHVLDFNCTAPVYSLASGGRPTPHQNCNSQTRTKI